MHFTSTLLPALATLSLTTALPALDNPTLEARTITYATNKYYSVADGDTATSISITEKVSTLDFMSVNNLGPQTRITPHEQLCLPKACNVWLVKDGNTCNGIVAAFHLKDLNQFLGWNKEIHKNCDNLELGTNVCISAPL